MHKDERKERMTLELRIMSLDCGRGRGLMRRPEPGPGSSAQCGLSALPDNIQPGKSGHVTMAGHGHS